MRDISAIISVSPNMFIFNIISQRKFVQYIEKPINNVLDTSDAH